MLIKANKKELPRKASAILTKSIRDLSRRKHKITLSLVGGRSVSGILKHLKKEKIPWEKVHIFLADERLKPITSDESNFNLINKTLTKNLVKTKKLPEKNLHPFIYTKNLKNDLGSYEKQLTKISNSFDIVLLSAGEDGHIASLFPNHETIKSRNRFFTSTRIAPKLPKGRMSATHSLLEKSKISILLFADKSKRQAFENFNNPKLTIQQCPAKIVKKIPKSYILTNLN